MFNMNYDTSFLHLALLHSCPVCFLNVNDIVIDFSLSTSIKYVAQWGHTSQDGGVRKLRESLHYVSPTQCARGFGDLIF